MRETSFNVSSLVMPYFVTGGRGIQDPISSLPGQFRYSQDQLLPECESLLKAGVRSILLFGVSETGEKDAKASRAASAKGVVQVTISEIKKRFPDLTVIADTCVCGYTHHGHCGLVDGKEIVNDRSAELIAKVALSQAEAGADMVAPSDMMDGRVRVVRALLDKKGFEMTPIMSYSAKFASQFYGPFRDAQESAPQFGDRKTYQLDFHNREEALREIKLDLEEGADIVMVKPALAYLDIIREAKNKFSHPLAAYSVSGEYAMIKSAASQKLADEKELAMEVAASIYRAGADILISYYAKDLAMWMKTT